MSIYRDYYVYAYLRENGTPYYIGKGRKYRAWSKQHTINLPTKKENIIIIEKNLSEIGSMAIERRLIRWYGRKNNNTGILQNLTDGGEGISGYKQSKQHVAKRVTKIKNNVNRKITEESKRLMILPHIGNKYRLGKNHKDETKSKISTGLKGNKNRLGKKHTEETKNKIRQTKLQKSFSTL